MRLAIYLLFLLVFPFGFNAQFYSYADEATADVALFSKKNVKEVNVYTQNGATDEILSEVRKYNSKGQLTERKKWDEFEEEYRFSFHVYDDAGRLIMVSEENQGGYIHDLQEFKYQDGLLISEQHSSMEYGAYTLYYVRNTEGRIDSSYIADAEPRKNAWHYSNSLLDSIVGFTVYDYENSDA